MQNTQKYKQFYLDEMMSHQFKGIPTGSNNDVFAFERKKKEPNIQERRTSGSQILNKRTNSGNEHLPIDAITNKENFIHEVEYAPFDVRFYSHDETLDSNRGNELIQQTAGRFNYCLLLSPPNGFSEGSNYFISQNPVSEKFFGTENSLTIFPLYLYSISRQNSVEKNLNINEPIISNLAAHIGLTFIPEQDTNGNVCMAGNQDIRPEFKITFTPVDFLDFVYGSLHNQNNNNNNNDNKDNPEKNAPLIPFPVDSNLFWKRVEMGSRMRKIHLLEAAAVQRNADNYILSGESILSDGCRINQVYWHPEEKTGNTGKIWINELQFFSNIPTAAWKFKIGNIKPAQRWLTERMGYTINNYDIIHYQKIISALMATKSEMKALPKQNSD